MKEAKGVAKEVAKIYHESGSDAKKYLYKARKLKDLYGPSFAIVYCWFYSVPQKWIQVEPKVFELAEKTNSINLEIIQGVHKEKLAAMLKPLIFRNKISSQLKNFCRAIKNEYLSWGNFARALKKENIFTIFEKLRKYKNTRLTFKNLAAMKIFIGGDDDLIILDTHVARLLGISRADRGEYITREKNFQKILDCLAKVNNELKKKLINDTSMAELSLAIWFNKANVSASQLLSLV